MTCPQCRFENATEASFCANCGHDLRQPPGVAAPGGFGPPAVAKKGLAITSFALGIASVPLVCLFGLGVLTALVAFVIGIVALVKANRSPAEYGGNGMAIAGIVTSGLCLLTVPILAAIAIPSLLRARVAANESAAIGDVRTVISGEAAYASANSGYYDTLECLGTPTQCIPGYPPTGPTFLDPSLTRVTPKSGYSRRFYPGTPGEQSSQVSPSSIRSFAYVAVPTERNRTGVRGFCGDDTGRICYSSDGSAPPVENGQCAPSCTALR